LELGLEHKDDRDLAELARVRALALERHTYQTPQDARSVREFEGIVEKLRLAGQTSAAERAQKAWDDYLGAHCDAARASKAQELRSDTLNYSSTHAILKLLMLISHSPSLAKPSSEYTAADPSPPPAIASRRLKKDEDEDDDEEEDESLRQWRQDLDAEDDALLLDEDEGERWGWGWGGEEDKEEVGIEDDSLLPADGDDDEPRHQQQQHTSPQREAAAMAPELSIPGLAFGAHLSLYQLHVPGQGQGGGVMLSPEQYSKKTAVVSESDVSKAVAEALLGLPSDIFHLSPATGLFCLSHFGSHVGIAGASCGAVGSVLRHFAALASDLLVLRAFASASASAPGSGSGPGSSSGPGSGSRSGGAVSLALRAWVLVLLGSIDRELSSLDSDIYGSSSGVSQGGAEAGEERARESQLGPAPASIAYRRSLLCLYTRTRPWLPLASNMRAVVCSLQAAEAGAEAGAGVELALFVDELYAGCSDKWLLRPVFGAGPGAEAGEGALDAGAWGLASQPVGRNKLPLFPFLEARLLLSCAAAVLLHSGAGAEAGTGTGAGAGAASRKQIIPSFLSAVAEAADEAAAEEAVLRKAMKRGEGGRPGGEGDNTLPRSLHAFSASVAGPGAGAGTGAGAGFPVGDGVKAMEGGANRTKTQILGGRVDQLGSSQVSAGRAVASASCAAAAAAPAFTAGAGTWAGVGMERGGLASAPLVRPAPPRPRPLTQQQRHLQQQQHNTQQGQQEGQARSEGEVFAPLSVQLSCLLVGPCTQASRSAQQAAFRSLWRGGLGDHVSFLLDTFLLRDAGVFGFVREATSAAPAEAVGSSRLAQSLTATLQGLPPPAGLTLVSVAFAGERGGAGAAGLLELVKGISIETHYSHPFRFVRLLLCSFAFGEFLLS